jgi:single-strand DNA-binding protein
MNKVQLTGRLTKAPESRKAGDATVASFTIATNEGKYHDRDLTQFIPCEAWGRDAETILDRFGQGDPIIITDGRIIVDSWEKDGERRYKTYVRVNRWEFPQGKPKGESERTAATTQGFNDIDDDDPDGELPF